MTGVIIWSFYCILTHGLSWWENTSRRVNVAIFFLLFPPLSHYCLMLFYNSLSFLSQMFLPLAGFISLKCMCITSQRDAFWQVIDIFHSRCDGAVVIILISDLVSGRIPNQILSQNVFFCWESHSSSIASFRCIRPTPQSTRVEKGLGHRDVHCASAGFPAVCPRHVFRLYFPLAYLTGHSKMGFLHGFSLPPSLPLGYLWSWFQGEGVFPLSL